MPTPTSAAPEKLETPRNLAVDLVRASCLIVVVGLHAMMVGVTVEKDGLEITNALSGNPIFAWTTWAVQVMPLFFLLGGFSSLTHWRRMRDRGATAGDYIRGRVLRLARPALLPIALVAATLATLTLVGTSPTTLAEVGFRIGQPLWFLAVYLGCSGLVPLMTWLHEAAPRITLVSLFAAAVAVDVLTAVLLQPSLGALNFLFVWLFIQQLGFWYADGRLARHPRWLMLAMGAAGYGALVVLTTGVGYSRDMYDNLNSPTLCILALGVAQLGLLAWAQPWLTRVASLSIVGSMTRAINRNSMTIYLWHVPVLVIVALSMIFARMPMPDPLTQLWWETRPFYLLAIALLLGPVVLLVERYDRWRTPLGSQTSSLRLAAASVVLAVAGVAVILILGFAPVFAALSLALLLLSLRLSRPRRLTTPGRLLTSENG